MQFPVHNPQGQVVGHIELDDTVFGVPFRPAVVHQALVRQQANARQGTASTKTRREVSGGGAKPWPQKYTGRSRQGSIRAPHWRGGGVVFGPHPRSYRQAMPKKMRRLAIRCLLSAKARDGQLTVVEGFGLEQPRTKDMVAILRNLGVTTSALLVTRDPEPAVIRSARNLPRVKTLPASYLNVADLCLYDRLVMTTEAVRRAEQVWSLAKVEA